jgi:hypothetical protein
VSPGGFDGLTGDAVRREAERLVAAAIATVSLAANSGAGQFATGSAECCVCPICRLIASMRNPNDEVVAKLASGAGDLAAGVASFLRSFSRPQATSEADDAWHAATAQPETASEADDGWHAAKAQREAASEDEWHAAKAQREAASEDEWHAAKAQREAASEDERHAAKAQLEAASEDERHAAKAPAPAPREEPAPVKKKVAKKAVRPKTAPRSE